MTLSDLLSVVAFSLCQSLTPWQTIYFVKHCHKHLADFCPRARASAGNWFLLEIILQRRCCHDLRQVLYIPSFVRRLCERSCALTHRIWLGWREDRLLNKWLLSHRGRQPLMSLSSQLARSTSSSKAVRSQSFTHSSTSYQISDK